MKKALAILFLLIAVSAAAQREPNRTGSFFFYWGYNRSFYTDSDIHLWGPGYDFTLYKVKATDRPSKWDPNVYLNPTQFTVPQFNFRVGYYFKPRWCITAGWDHMKYVLQNYTHATIEGEISPEASTALQGNYHNDIILLAPNFLRYEHTDGLNYVRFGLESNYTFLKLTRAHVRLKILYGIGLGPMLTYTDTYLFGTYHRTKPHISGFGTSLLSGLRLELGKHFFLSSEVMGGYANLLNVRTTLDSDRADQTFWFGEVHFVGGMFIKPRSKRKHY